MLEPNRLHPRQIKSLSARQRRLMLALMAGLAPTEACRVAGYAETTIGRGVSKIKEYSQVQSVISYAMAQAGITPEYLAGKLKEGIDFNNPILAAAYSTRHKYLETALRLAGHEPDKATDIEETYEERILRIRAMRESRT